MAYQERPTPNEISISSEVQIKLAPPTTLKALLPDRDIAEPDGLHLGEASIHAGVISKGFGVHEHFVVVNSGLAGSDFLKFLTAASPYKYGSEFGVLDDWRLPDQAYSGSMRLKDLHAHGLGASWQLFEQHRRLFISTLDSKVQPPQSLQFGPLLTERQIRQEASYGGKQTFRGDRLKELLSRDEAQEVKDALIAYARQDRQVVKGKRVSELSPDVVLGRFFFIGVKQRGRILREFLATTTPEMRDTFSRLYRDKLYSSVVYTNDEGEDQYGYSTQYGNKHIQVDHDNGKYTVSTDYYHAEADLKAKESQLQFVLRPDTVQQWNKLVPVLHWRTVGDDTLPVSTRTWIDDPLTGTLAEQLAPFLEQNQIPANEKSTASLNTLAGLLSLAYFSPEIIIQWPDHVGLPNSNYKQIMGPAQIPVLAHIRRQELVNGQVIKGIEAYTRETIAN